MKSSRAEGYIDVCIGLIVFLSVIVLTISIYSFFPLKTSMDEIANQLIDVATYTGEFGEDFNDLAARLQSENPSIPFTVSVSANQWFNSTLKQVQYGDRMTVTIHTTKSLNGGGIFKLNIPCSVSRSGLSRNMRKGVEDVTEAEGGGGG